VTIVEEEDEFDVTTLLSYAIVVAIAVAAYFQFNANKAVSMQARLNEGLAIDGRLCSIPLSSRVTLIAGV
jgi:hypothetical protein